MVLRLPGFRPRPPIGPVQPPPGGAANIDADGARMLDELGRQKIRPGNECGDCRCDVHAMECTGIFPACLTECPTERILRVSNLQWNLGYEPLSCDEVSITTPDPWFSNCSWHGTCVDENNLRNVVHFLLRCVQQGPIRMPDPPPGAYWTIIAWGGVNASIHAPWAYIVPRREGEVCAYPAVYQFTRYRGDPVYSFNIPPSHGTVELLP